MGDDLTIIPAPRDAEGFTALSRSRQGRLFRKHMLTLGNLIHPKTGENLTLDDNWYAKLKDNFNSGVCDIVQVPLADDQNKHSEDPLRNIGEVVDIERDGDKVFAVMDIRDTKAAEKLGTTLLGSSAFLHMNYTDTRTGKAVGPTLLHNCVTNRPYVVGLDDYEEVIAASADGTGEVLLLTPEGEPEVPTTKEDLIAGLKEHGIDVEALQAAAAQRSDTTQLTSAIVEALKSSGSEVELTGGQEGANPSDVVGAIVELAATTRAQGDEIGALKLSAAEREVDGYISVGRALPKSRSTLVQLALTNRDALDSLVAPANDPFVKMSNTKGTGGDAGQDEQKKDIDAELAALTAQHSEFFNK
jgi:hypothetical protein